MTKLTTTTLIKLEIDQTMKEYKKRKKKNSKAWKNAFEAECHQEAVFPFCYLKRLLKIIVIV